MFGGTLVCSADNSPLLQRSGSWLVFNEIVAGERGNSVAEGFSHSAEENDFNGAGAPLSKMASIMPLPTLLLKFKVLLFVVWACLCSKVGWDSVMRMSADLQALFVYETFLYYNPLLLMTLMVGLWGINLWVFSQANVKYSKIFDLDEDYLTHKEIWKCAIWMIIIVTSSMTGYLYFYSHGEVSLAAFQPVLLYAVIPIVLVFPFDIFYCSSRYFLLATLWRIIFPLQAIAFVDFFLADILTSMSKVFSDMERCVCRMVNQQVATIAWFEADSICGSHSVAIPLVLVWPYLFRFFQCLRRYKDTQDNTNLFNALKYSTAVPVIFLSALKYHVLPDRWENIYWPLWVFSSVVNSMYSFYWDVTQDWNLSGFTLLIFKFKKQNFCSKLLYTRNWVFFWVIGSNFILRCTWSYKLSVHLRHDYITVFVITALEIFRRFQWVFFRVENELHKMSSNANMQNLLDDTTSEEEDKLLKSDSFDV